MSATVSQLLETAVAKHQQGNLEEAALLYNDCLLKDPHHIDSLRLLAILFEQQGDYAQSLALAERAIKISPKTPELRLLQAEALLGQNRMDEAFAAAEAGLSLAGSHIDLLLFLGDLCQQKQDYQTALAYYHRAERADGNIPELANNMGNLRKAMGEPEAAVAYYQKAIHLNPDYAEAYFNLGALVYELGNYQEGLRAFTKAIELSPGFYQARIMQGVVLKSLGEYEAAEETYRNACELIPANTQERRILWYNWGNLHLARKHFDQAADYYREALSISPNDIPTLHNLANVLTEQGEAEDAIRIYGRLATLCPETPAFAINQVLTLPVIYQNTDEVHRWRGNYLKGLDQLLETLHPIDAPELLNKFVQNLSTTGFYLAYQGLGDRFPQEKTAQLFRQILGMPTTKKGLSPFRRGESDKIRIGFISRHLSANHTIGKLLEGIIQRLSRDKFEVIIFSVGNEHPYTPPSPGDPLHHPEDKQVELPLRDFVACRDTLFQAELDILYFTDLGMDVVTALLAHYRFAPLQCTTWGHPVTTGSPNMDYFISSQFVERPSSEVHYTETLYALENYPFYYQRPQLETIPVSRDDLGLLPGQHLYTCVQSIFKLHPDMDFIFGEILRRDQTGILVLLSHQSDRCNQALLNRIALQAPDAVDRIRFVQRLPRAEFLGLMAISDILLDSMYFSGGNTSYEGLAFGTPIITLDAPYMKGRLTLGLYKQMGLMDCVALSLEEYVEKAVAYGVDDQARGALKQEILRRCPVLYENEAPIRELEEFLITALERSS